MSEKYAVHAAAVAGSLALVGIVIGGIVEGLIEQRSARDNQNSIMIARALESESKTSIADNLVFMTEVGIIRDENLKKNVTEYLELVKAGKRNIPQLSTTTVSVDPDYFTIIYTAEIANREKAVEFACKAISRISNNSTSADVRNADIEIWSNASGRISAVTVGGRSDQARASVLKLFARNTLDAQDAFVQPDRDWSIDLTQEEVVKRCGSA